MRRPRADREPRNGDRKRLVVMANFNATHSINCFCPGCGYSVSKSASSSESQQAADSAAEGAATQEFANHNCPCK